jgi:glycosyltransferase involved in cell wall biosynthesis
MQKKIKVAFVASMRFPPEKASSIRVLNQARAILDQADVYIFGVSSHRENERENIQYILAGEIYKNSSITYTWRIKLPLMFGIIRNLIKENRSQEFNILHCHTPEGLVIGSFSRLFMKDKPKLILDMHGPFLDEMSFYGMLPNFLIKILMRMNFERRFYNLADEIITSGSALATSIQKLGIKRNIEVVQDYVSLSRLKTVKKKSNSHGGIIRVAYCGTLKSYQGVEDLLYSAKEVWSEGYIFELNIIGGLGLGVDHYRSIASNLNIISNVRFTGMLEHSEALNEMSQMDILVSPRRRTQVTENGFVSQLPEYMGMGKAIIASRISECDVMLGENHPGLYEANSQLELKNRLIEFIKNSNLRSQAGEIAEQRANIWSWEFNSGRLIKLYEKAN